MIFPGLEEEEELQTSAAGKFAKSEAWVCVNLIQEKQLQILTTMTIFMIDMTIFAQASTTEGCSTGKSAAFKRSQQCKVVRIKIICWSSVLWL